MSKLTPKQKAFADYYIESGNGAESAKRAGYKGNNLNRIASENLSKLDISKYIDERLKEIDSKRIMGAKEALELLSSIARGETQEEVIVSNSDGFARVMKIPDIKDRMKAVESLLKRYPINRQEELREQLLEAQIDKVKAETKNEETGINRVVIINDIPKDDET